MGDGRMSGNGCFLDECSSIADCVENATCVNSPDGFVCLCPFGFMGDGKTSGNGCFADECSTISDCVENATCINSADGFICLCNSGFYGDGQVSGNGCRGMIYTTCDVYRCLHGCEANLLCSWHVLYLWHMPPHMHKARI